MKRKIALGPGAASLILIVVILSLCMLTILMQIGARNDLSLSDRGTQMITGVYELFDRSERRLAKLDTVLARCQEIAKDQGMDEYLELVEQNLPEGFTMDVDGRIITWQEPLDRRVLTCSVRLLDIGEEKRTEWVHHTFTEPQEQQKTAAPEQEEGEFPE